MKNTSFKSELIEKFDQSKIAGAGALAPRKGNYFIRTLEFREIGVKGMVPIAKVNWKTNEANFFLEDQLFEIALSGFNRNSTGDKLSNDFNGLIGKYIAIDDVKIDFVFENNKTNKVLNFQWSIIENAYPFKTSSQLALQAFFGSTTTLKDAQQNFISNASYDVAAAEESEVISNNISEYDDLGPDDNYDGDSMDHNNAGLS